MNINCVECTFIARKCFLHSVNVWCFCVTEIRPAPQMDNLVSIYKSLEAASGVNIFVTQTETSTKIAGTWVSSRKMD